MINADGTQLGVMSREEALTKAREQELDLVEIAAQAKPPVAKLIDYEKFRYQEEKKEQAARKNIREVELKEIWLSPRIAEHDLDTRLKKADEFISRGNKVKLNVKFKGREMAHPETGYKVTENALTWFKGRVEVERETKFEGRNLTTIIGASKENREQKEQENAESQN